MLFDKLLKRRVPLYVVRIFIFWYTVHFLNNVQYVRWNNVISSGFSVSNGVGQGGILSLRIFSVSIDDLSIKQNDINVGCTIGRPTTLINHLMYADDLVLLSPSAMGLSLLLSVCLAYGTEHDIKYNSAKSNVMLFRCNKIKYIRIPNFVLNNLLLARVTKYIYLGHCISDDLSDDDDMARQYRQIYAQCNAFIRNFFMCTESVKIAFFVHFVQVYIHVNYGGIIGLNHWGNYV